MKQWQKVIIGLVTIGLLIGSGIMLYDSDWFINKTMHLKKEQGKKIGNRLTWDYTNKYEEGKLKIYMRIHNADKEVFDFVRVYLTDDDYVFKINLLDKDEFKIAEITIKSKDLISQYDKADEYLARVSFEMNKKDARKIYEVRPSYRGYLDKNTKEFFN